MYDNVCIYFKLIRFPIDKELKKKWINALKRKHFQPSQHSRICSVHFNENNFQIQPYASRPLLKSNTVPTIFPSSPSYYQNIKKSRKEPALRISIQDNIINGIITIRNIFY